MRVFLLAFGAFSLLATHAATPSWAAGTAPQRAACEDDAYRLCSAEIPNESAIESCLRSNLSRISRDCRRLLTSSTGN